MRTNTINIADILAKQPIGTKLYSPILGDMYLDHLDADEGLIFCRSYNYADLGRVKFTEDGRYADLGRVTLGPCPRWGTKKERACNTFNE